MWSDDINKKILEGEDTNHSNHPEKAWNDMEALLDKHLPQEKKRRRIIFFLLPVLLGAGLATFYFLQKTNHSDRPVTEQKNIPGQSISQSPEKVAEKNPSAVTPRRIRPPGNDNKQKNTGQSTPGEPTTTTTEKNREGKPVFQQNINAKKRLESAPEEDQPLESSRAVKNKKLQAEPGLPKKVSADITVKPVDELTPIAPATKTFDIDSSNKAAVTAAEKKESLDSLEKNTTAVVDPAKKTNGSPADKFSLNISFGPDISSVGIDHPGPVQFQYGIGAAYAINKNLVIRTGFYAGHKKYDADSADYHLTYPINKLGKIEADCYVYEIPLSLAYNFNQVKKHNWFVAGGVSSYIMKKETYGYYYQNTWGQPQYYDHTYKNENTHLFSVISISGGYRYHLSDRVSFLAEPYVKFPVSGIGAGKVKLNNTGILFTVGYKPFSKK